MEKTNSIFIIDENDRLDQYRSLSAGKPFRLFKFGEIWKNGKKRVVKPELPIKLPKFKVPIKLGSHDEKTPAGGWITALEQRSDGVYATGIELNDEGKQALERGDYRYHSPEIIWQDGYIEDADTGEKITGPLLLGVALVHTPHLGETTAFYTYNHGEVKNMENFETVNVPKDWFDRVLGVFKSNKPEPTPEPTPETETVREPAIEVDEFELIKQERDNFEAELNAIKQAQAKAELYAVISAEFETDEYGPAFKEMPDDELVKNLADLTEEQRSYFMGKFRALSAQVNEGSLTDEIGIDEVVTDKDAFAVAVDAYRKENGVDYTTAVKIVATERPELYNQWRTKGGN